MNRFKFNAFVEEFPFLIECNNNLYYDRQRDYHDCDGITIKRATKELMSFVPRYDGASGSMVGIDDNQRIDFVLSNGIVITNAIKKSGYCVHNEAHQDNESWHGETILEGIDKHDVSHTLKFIVQINSGYVIHNHYSEPNYNITIFKPSREFKFSDLVDRAKKKAIKEVLAESNF